MSALGDGLTSSNTSAAEECGASWSWRCGKGWKVSQGRNKVEAGPYWEGQGVRHNDWVLALECLLKIVPMVHSKE